jgi:hypothetical protein
LRLRIGEEYPTSIRALKVRIQSFHAAKPETQKVSPKQLIYRLVGLHAIEKMKPNDERVVWRRQKPKASSTFFLRFLDTFSRLFS